MKRFHLALILVAVVMLFACGNKDIAWTYPYKFSGNRWFDDQQIVFAPDSGYFDSIQPVKGVISLRYGRGCPVEQIPLVIETLDPESGSYRRDSIRFRLLPGNLRNGDHATMGIFESSDTVTLSPPPSDGWEMTVKPQFDTLYISDVYSLTLQILK